MTLKDEIDQTARTVHTSSITYSFGELITMYEEGDLNISPEFQRLFRWSTEKKSRFIESLLINIPVPSIFVYELEDGKWELVDGLQRLSTVLEFSGRLRDPNTKQRLPATVLESTSRLLKNSVLDVV